MATPVTLRIQFRNMVLFCNHTFGSIDAALPDLRASSAAHDPILVVVHTLDAHALTNDVTVTIENGESGGVQYPGSASYPCPNKDNKHSFEWVADIKRDWPNARLKINPQRAASFHLTGGTLRTDRLTERDDKIYKYSLKSGGYERAVANTVVYEVMIEQPPAVLRYEYPDRSYTEEIAAPESGPLRIVVGNNPKGASGVSGGVGGHFRMFSKLIDGLTDVVPDREDSCGLVTDIIEENDGVFFDEQPFFRYPTAPEECFLGRF